MKKPRKMGKERRTKIKTIIKNIPGPKSFLKQIEFIGDKDVESPYDMMDEEEEMIQYGIETTRKMEEQRRRRDMEAKKVVISEPKTDNRGRTPPRKAVIKEMENTKTDKIFSEENLTEREIDPYELGKHFTKNNAWTAINGSVFNITEFVKEHPGGAVILKAAGKDGTSLFSKLYA